MPELEGAEERAQRGGRVHAIKQATHTAMSEQAHIFDRIRTRNHARDQGGDLRSRVRAFVGWDGEMFPSEMREACPFGEAHHGHQARTRYEIRVIECC